MKLLKTWDQIEDILTGTFFFIGVSIIFFGVIMRYVFNNSLIWTDEFSIYFIIWGTVMGWSVAQRDNRHIRVNFVFDRFSLEHQRTISIFSNLICIAFCIFLGVAAVVLEQSYILYGIRSINIAFPLWIVYVFFPLAALMLGLRFVHILVLLLKDGGSGWYAMRREELRKLAEGKVE